MCSLIGLMSNFVKNICYFFLYAIKIRNKYLWILSLTLACGCSPLSFDYQGFFARFAALFGICVPYPSLLGLLWTYKGCKCGPSDFSATGPPCVIATVYLLGCRSSLEVGSLATWIFKLPFLLDRHWCAKNIKWNSKTKVWAVNTKASNKLYKITLG